MAIELTFTREDVPTITRAGGSGREAEPWETHLAPLKATPNEGFRVWTYDKRTSAVSRMSSVRERLTKAVESENWKLAVRQVPGTDGETTKFGVYVTYMGQFTEAEIEANRKAHAERSKRVTESRAAAKAEREAAATNGAPAEEAPTAKEVVTQARQRKAS